MDDYTEYNAKWQVPHRISGFFQIPDPENTGCTTDPLKIGSRGGGPALSAFGTTHVKLDIPSTTILQDSGEPAIYTNISINDEDVSFSALTSLSVVEYFTKYLPPNSHLWINHKFELPLGAGYGSSGAGSLGLALCLVSVINDHISKNNLKESNIDLEYACKAAHTAEVLNKSGLGTVGGQWNGGLSITHDPGFPFAVRKIQIPREAMLTVISNGGISTNSILSDLKYRRIIFNAGLIAMKEILGDFTLHGYMKTCRHFLDNTQLPSLLNLPYLSEIIDDLSSKLRWGAAMNQLGNSIFIFHTSEEKKVINSILDSYRPFILEKELNVEQNGPKKL